MVQRGWLYILIGLLISSFLGGAIHVFFSPARMRDLVEKVMTRKQPKFDIEFVDARLQFAGEWWPTIAIELTGLSVRAKDPCITNSIIHADRLLVPFETGALLKKSIRFGHIRAGKVRFFLRPATCAAPVLDTPAGDGFAPLERFFQKRWSKEVVNTTRFLERLTVSSLEVLRDDEALAPAILENIDMRFDGKKGESTVGLQVQIGAPWVGDAAVGKIQTQIVIRADELQLRGEGNLKEGQFQLAGDWAIDRGEIGIKLSTQDLPANQVLRVLHQWDLVRSFNPNLKNQWATCDFTLAGDIRNFKKLPVELHQCRLYGDFGEIQLLTQRLKDLSEGGELRLQIQDIDVKRALASLGFGRHWGVVSQFGRFTGLLTVKDRRTYELEGRVRDTELYFKSVSNQIRQNIESFDLALSMDGDRFSGQAGKFVVKEGKVEGGFSFNISPEGSGLFQVAFERVILPADVQKIISGGRVPEGALYGQGMIRESSLGQFTGRLAFKEWLTPHWELHQIKLAPSYQDGRWKVDSSAEEFRLRPESTWVPLVNSLISELKPRPSDAVFRQLAAEIDIRDGNWEWKNLMARVPSHGAKYSSAGQWTAQQGVRGWVSGHYSKKHNRTWVLSGTLQKPAFKSADAP